MKIKLIFPNAFVPKQILFLLIVLLAAGCQKASALPENALPQTPPAGNPQTIVRATTSPTPTATATAAATPTPTATFTPTATIAVFGPSEYPGYINPLTGKEVLDPELLDRPPVMVKVSNFPREGRPHAGLSFADIVFDYYIGEGTNRLLALYYGQNAPKVGPIRSARLVDAQLATLYQGILVYAGADYNRVSPVIYRELGNRAFTNSNATCPALCDDGPHTVFSVFADTGLFSDYARGIIGSFHHKPDFRGMYFSSARPGLGLPADQVTIRYNAYNLSQWSFDSVAQSYLVSMENVDQYNNLIMVPLTDRLTGEKLSFSNLIVVFAKYNEFAPTLHDIELWYNNKGNRAVLFRDGEAIEAQWKTAQTDLPIEFLTIDQQPLPLKPGNSWIAIMGLNSTVQQTSQGQWEVQFSLP